MSRFPFRLFGFCTQFLLSAAVLFSSSNQNAFGQTEQVLQPNTVLSLAKSVPADWAAGLRPATVASFKDHAYVLMLPTGNSGAAFSSMLILSEDGSLVGSKRLAGTFSPYLGVDPSGDIILLRRDSRSSGVIEVHNAGGELSMERSPIHGALALRQAELALAISNGQSFDLGEDPNRAREISQTLHDRKNHHEYVTALLGDGSTATLDLARPRLTVADVSGSVRLERTIGREILDRYSFVSTSNDPNVSYPSFIYQP